MINRKDLNRTLAFVCALVAIVVFTLYFQLNFIRSNETFRIQYTPDDAYYYLTLARHFAQSCRWTFDGINPGSGFHLLWGYILAGLWWVFSPGTRVFVQIAYVAELLVVITLVMFLVYDVFRRNYGFVALLVLSALVVTEWFRIESISLTEWSVVVLSCYLFYAYRSRSPGIAFVLALVGTLARADFVLFACSFLVVDFLMQPGKHAVKLAAYAVAGILAGVGLVALHSYLITGDVLQSSVRMKLYWGNSFRSGTEKVDAISLVTRTVGFDGIPFVLKQKIFAFVAFAPLVMMLFALKRHQWYVVREVAGAVIALMVYTLFYYRTGSIQAWWSAEIVVSIFVAWMVSLEYLWTRLGGALRTAIVAALALLVLHNATFSASPPYQHQQYMLQAGTWLKNEMHSEKIGAWNAGIIGYFEGGNVVNLDGLVNGQVQGYIMKNRLAEYLRENGVHYVIDASEMFVLKDLRVRGGYDDTLFLNGMRAIKTFDDGKYDWRYLTLYSIQ